MSGLSLLDVAIGMVFMYLLLSLICSALNESISAILQARARFLEKGILRLLDGPEFTARIYDHPLVRNLYDDVHPYLRKLGRRNLPSYIPSTNFALALMDLIQPGGARYALAGPSVDAETVKALLASLNQPECPLPSSVRRAVITLIQAAGDDITKVRECIEDWYDSTMDRVSGAYKRRTHYVLFVLGLLSTIAINADSVVVAKRLATTRTLTAAVTDSAEHFVDKGSSGQSDPAEALTRTLVTLDKLGLPIGWDGPDKTNLAPALGLSAAGEWLSLGAMHWPGWLLTALAISFGAPFWFDVLSRFMVVRSTVKPEKKPQ
ncbi:MAG TPA: hypothetical protein VLT57_09850 [Bryobacteraceae bacterium]|nr:hypothetical protein [Bryobacteraceae bacterium]